MLVFLKKKDIFYFFHSKQKCSIIEVIDFFYVTFKIILLKIDRPPTLLAHLHILFVVGKVFVIKRKTMAHTEETIKKWKQEFFLASVHHSSEVNLCSGHLSKRNHQ